ncbi:MAG: Asp23/Gls24 family envelope stress response protein [Clostridia bacterium]|nr:Asp23/Gls24 family envelope stress response protein [Clostridia bacterium]
MAEINNQMQENKGKITCDRNILVSIISLATKEISGVTALQDCFSMKFKRFFTKAENTGVKLKFASNGQLTIDVYVRIQAGTSVPEIAYKIQENIKNNIVSMVDMRVSKINVHVVGVDFKSDEIQQN